MSKTKILIFIILSSLLLSLSTAQAQIVHENPDSLPAREPYDADQKLALSLQGMFGSLDSFVADINASDFAASREDIRLFTLSHENFTEVYRRANLSGTDLQAIAGKLAAMPDDLWATLNSTEAYSAARAQFGNFSAAGDVRNATQIAAGLQVSYRNVSESLQRFGANSTAVLRGLGGSSVDTTRLESGLAGVSRLTAKVNESIREPSSLLGNTSLALAAGSYAAGTGDFLTLTATLATAGPLSGHHIRYYVDDSPIGDATTDWTGSGPFVYRVDGRSFNRTMLVHAEFIPDGESLAPAASNVIAIARRPEPAVLLAHVTPRTATCGDSVLVTGSLDARGGTPAASLVVNISLAGAAAGNATTGADGSYSYMLAIGPGTPAGDDIIQSAYDSPPWSALLSAISTQCILTVVPQASVVTLDPPEPAYAGGQVATFQGTITTANGQPVAGANVTVFVADVPVGTNGTDAGGRFSVVAPVPFDVAPGDRGIYAIFDPGDGKALTGAKSNTFLARFEPATPRATVRGLPLLAFPGDGISLTGVLMTSGGQPLGGRQITIAAPGVAAAVTTDSCGNFQVAGQVAGGPGVSSMTISVPGDGLLTGGDYRTGTVLVMPFDRMGTALAVIVLLLAAGLAAMLAKSRRSGRRGRRPSRPSSSPVRPGPAAMSATYSFAEDLETIDQAISMSSDRSEAVRSIYLATRRMLYDRDPALPPAATHRELCQLLSGRQPALSGPLGTITASYEGVVFGHRVPTDEAVYGSLYSLGELRKTLYSEGGFSP